MFRKLYDITFLKWCFILIFGVMTPFYLSFFICHSHFFTIFEQQKVSFIEKIDDRLDLVASYCKDDVFYHGLLQKNFQRANLSGGQSEEISQVIHSLKKSFPKTFRFVIWNKSGKIDSSLSDEKRYFYIYNSFYEIMHDLYASMQSGKAQDPEQNKAVLEKVAMLRSCLGKFLLPKELNEPFKAGFLGRCLRSGLEPTKRMIWYQVYAKFSVLCFISEVGLNKDIGPKLMCQKSNIEESVIKLGIYNPLDFSVAGIRLSSAEFAEIERNAGIFLQNARTGIDSERLLIVFRQVAPDKIVFGFTNKAQNLIDPNSEVWKFFFSALKIIFLAGFLLYCYQLRFPVFFFSIHQKLLVLFLFSGALPPLILLAAGSEYYGQKKLTEIRQIQNNSKRLLDEFDSFFPIFKKRLANKLSGFISKEEGLACKKPTKESLAALENHIRSFSPDDYYLTDSNGTMVVKSQAKSPLLNQIFPRALSFLNCEPAKDLGDKSFFEKYQNDGSIFYGFLKRNEQISLQNVGSVKKWCYISIVGNRQEHKAWGILLIFWSQEKFLRLFLDENRNLLSNDFIKGNFVVMDTNSRKIFPENLILSRKLIRILDQTKTRKIIFADRVNWKAHDFVLTSVTGSELSETTLMHLYPFSQVEKALSAHEFQIKFLFFSCIGFALILYWFFSERFSAPVVMLSHGLKEVKARNFAYRFNYDSKDEFETLFEGFNSAMNSMGELSLGTSVQRGLLPDEKARFGSMELFANSVYMTKMGGDYYDYFSTGDSKLIVFFGDVAGHGIPAALLMAMAKAAIVLNKSEDSSPATILNAANATFFNLKSQGWKRMMTALSFELDCNTGDFKFANAGQCFPARISADGRTFCFLRSAGFPLGCTNKVSYKEISGRLEPGETLILYSDGIIEAIGPDNEIFGFDRFEELAKRSWDPDLGRFWKNIFSIYQKWAIKKDDDISFMFIKFDPETGGVGK